MSDNTNHVHDWQDVVGFVPGTKQTCACGAYRYPTIEGDGQAN